MLEMSVEFLFMIMTIIGCFSLLLEKNLTWMAHVSGVCLIILVAMFFSNINIIPSEHILYDFFTQKTVLIGIILMTMGLNFKEIINLPKKIILLFFIGAMGTILGGIFAAFLTYPYLGENAFKVAAQLSASYIGGGENAVAIKNMLDIQNELFISAFAFDNIMTTIWFFVTLSYAKPSIQNAKQSNDSDKDINRFDGAPLYLTEFLITLGLAFLIFELSTYLSIFLGIHKILVATIFALIVGQIPFLKGRIYLSYMMGSILFVYFFFSIGAISSLKEISKIPISIIIMPVVIVLTQALCMIIFGKILKTNSLESSICSQSLVGGPATAVAVAQAKKSKEGITLGLLLGLLGYGIGSFCGVFVYKISKMIIE
jgi:uncharacterized membrane protein